MELFNLQFFILLATLFQCAKGDRADDLLRKDSSLKQFIQLLNPKDERTDIVFLMDESGSLTRNSDHFNTQKLFIEMVARFFVIKPENTRLSLITFGNYARVQADYINNPKGDICNFLAKLSGVNIKGGFTNPQEALTRADKVLTSTSTAKRKYIIVLSDGCKNLGKDPLETAKELQEIGILIFGVAIGKKCQQDLKKILSSPSYMYTVNNINKIKELNTELKISKTNQYSIPLKRNDYCSKLCKSGKNCCDLNAQCACDSSGDYKCICQPGTTGSGLDGRCLRCPRGTYSGTGKSKCQNCPLNSNTSFQGATSIKACRCNPGYFGFPEHNSPCTFRKCSKLRPPKGGVLDPPHCGRELNESCAFWCKYPNCPYDSKDSNCLEKKSRKLQNPRYCMENRKWSGPEMKCEVATCLHPPTPKNAHYKCDSRSYNVGSKCFITCEAGYNTAEKGKINYVECASNGTWIGLSVLSSACTSQKCPPLKVDFKVKTQPTECNKISQPVGTKCMFFCTNGYKLVNKLNTNVVTCNKNANWNHDLSTLRCQDEYGPTITCPPSDILFNDPLQKTTIVSWTQPTTTDNDGYPSTVISVNSSISSPYFFEIGEHKLMYVAVDINGLSATCEFTITVSDVEPPLVKFCPGDEEVFKVGKSVAVMWKEPEFWDNSGHYYIQSQTHKIGDSFDTDKSHKVVYIVSDAAGNTASCQFNIYMKLYKCPYHIPPINGELQCNDVPTGQECTVFCNSGYEFINQPEITYNCVNNNGNYQWIQHGQVSSTLWENCAEKTLPGRGTLKGQMGFYTKKCVDLSEEELAAMGKEIENNLKTESPICENALTCALKMEAVSCISPPPQSVRRKRDTDNEYIVNFDLQLDFDVNDNYTGQITDEEIFPLSRNVVDPFYKAVDTNENATFHTEVTLECVSSLSSDDVCLKCPVGTFFDEDVAKCTLCPFHTYQDTTSVTECKPCPNLHFTLEEGAVNENQCKAACEIGEYSKTGLAQCLACPIGTYQNETGQVNCKTCSEGKTTWSVGAYWEDQCTSPCSPGHYSPTGFEPCVPCSRGFYQSRKQSTECVKCDHTLSTKGIGSFDVKQCLEIDLCTPNPCYNNAECMYDNGKVKCQCRSGYLGSRCDIAINHCDDLSCLNGGSCVNNNQSYTCNCPVGYSGFYCEEKEHICAEGTCVNGGTCIDNGNSYRCECLNGYKGKNCEQNIDDCIPGACQNGGSCFDNGKPQADQQFYCCCPNGYYGPLCDKVIDNCDLMHCANGGKCSEGKCLCTSGFTGYLCEEKINYCLSQPCRNHGMCINNKEKFSCQCTPGFRGDRCENKLSFDYDMLFRTRDTSSYALVETNKNLYALTISFWMKVQPDIEYLGTPISYSYISPSDKHTESNGLTFYNVNELVIYLHGVELQTLVRGTRDSDWHHYAFTWDSFNGAWKFYKDGDLIINGFGVGVGIPMWKGYLVIGQDQNTFGGGFRQMDSFKGLLSQINLWDFAMELEEIKQLHRSCGYIGNVVGWPDIGTYSQNKNFVKLSPSNICSEINACGLNEVECHCHNNNIFNKTLCENRLQSCGSDSCHHFQSCTTVNNVSFCECDIGYTGKFCQYDINECLQENGGCSHLCINKQGSHICSCPKGYQLMSDGRTCKSLRQCLYKDLLYAEKEEWIDGCEKCSCIKGNVKCHPKKCKKIECLLPFTLIRNPEDCCPTCNRHTAVCTITNQNLFTTFDGNEFVYTGDCQDVLAQDCSQDRFSIHLRILKSPSIQKTLVVRSHCDILELTFEGAVSLNGELKRIPYQHKFNKFRVDLIKSKSSKNIPKLVITMLEGVTVSWYRNENIKIHVPKEMYRQMCGLCGNYNDNQTDDTMIRNYTIVNTLAEFVQNWKIETASCPAPVYYPPGLPDYQRSVGLCKNSAQNWKYALEKCEALRTSSFYTCYKVINPQEGYDSCIHDACHCTGNLCYCDAIHKYIAECRNHNVEIGEWIGKLECEKRCQNGTVFVDCAPACSETCDKHEKNDPQCNIETCRAGCHCPSHMVMHEGNCILEEDCP